MCSVWDSTNRTPFESLVGIDRECNIKKIEEKIKDKARKDKESSVCLSLKNATDTVSREGCAQVELRLVKVA